MDERYGFRPVYNPSAPYPHYPSVPSLPGEQVLGNNQAAYRWIDSSTSYSSVPPSAVEGGVDADGSPIYVGRAFHQGDLIPAKVIPGKNAAYVAYNGEEHLVHNYQVLCRSDFSWVPSSAGHIPPGAVPGGHTSQGDTLYIGRAFHEGSHTIGKIHPSHGVCYIPFGGQEIACPEYETLVLRN